MIDRELTVDDTPTIRVTIRSGRVNVEGGKPGLVRFKVDTTDPTFEIRQAADAIVASSDRGGRVFVTVSVPPMTDMEIGTASGDVDIDPRLGRLDVTTVSGEVEFETVERLQARTTSGGIRGKRVNGEATCVTHIRGHQGFGDRRSRRLFDTIGIGGDCQLRRDRLMCDVVGQHPDRRTERANGQDQVDVRRGPTGVAPQNPPRAGRKHSVRPSDLAHREPEPGAPRT